MSLQDAHASYWLAEDTKQVRDVAVSVSLSANRRSRIRLWRDRVIRARAGPLRFLLRPGGPLQGPVAQVVRAHA